MLNIQESRFHQKKNIESEEALCNMDDKILLKCLIANCKLIFRLNKSQSSLQIDKQTITHKAITQKKCFFRSELFIDLYNFYMIKYGIYRMNFNKMFVLLIRNQSQVMISDAIIPRSVLKF
ncbi:hypothetical protein BpHYR1_035202 [Brachionus plicatilis]|uniref:Uncharacterized protein n=1 Tax=Brachionus plicatilis TaxID=10195 RepID=A0A3M7T9E5_BRAPC|nr:hypothetical protein BpHYR1_035202 [Brachionus plicatilis]